MEKYQSGNFRVCNFEKVLEQFRKLLMITALVTGEEEELPRVISMMILRMTMIVFCVTIVVENSMRMQQQDI
jgi:hypothetical protein